MRVAMLLLCLVLSLALAGCAGGKFPGEQPASDPAPAEGAASSPAAGNSSASNPPAQASTSRQEPVAPDSVRLTHARVDCWMKVEHQKVLRDIDRRIAFVDKCVADAMKAQSQ
jgi:hypothetical protein